MKVTRQFSRVHTAASPFFTSAEREKLGIEDSYGGIAGTLSPSSIEQILIALKLDPLVDTFCDMGSGTGVVTLAAAAICVKSEGFEIDSVVWLGSVEITRRLGRVEGLLKAEAKFYRGDLLKIEALNATALYSFTGYSKMTYAAACLAASTGLLFLQSMSPSVTPLPRSRICSPLTEARPDAGPDPEPDPVGAPVPMHPTTFSAPASKAVPCRFVRLAIVAVHPEDLYKCGLVAGGDSDFETFKVKMPAGNAYDALVVPMTEDRCKRVLSTRSRRRRR